MNTCVSCGDECVGADPLVVYFMSDWDETPVSNYSHTSCLLEREYVVTACTTCHRDILGGVTWDPSEPFNCARCENAPWLKDGMSGQDITRLMSGMVHHIPPYAFARYGYHPVAGYVDMSIESCVEKGSMLLTRGDVKIFITRTGYHQKILRERISTKITGHTLFTLFAHTQGALKAATLLLCALRFDAGFRKRTRLCKDTMRIICQMVLGSANEAVWMSELHLGRPS
jgi:hypothetical protein